MKYRTLFTLLFLTAFFNSSTGVMAQTSREVDELPREGRLKLGRVYSFSENFQIPVKNLFEQLKKSQKPLQDRYQKANEGQLPPDQYLADAIQFAELGAATALRLSLDRGQPVVGRNVLFAVNAQNFNKEIIDREQNAILLATTPDFMRIWKRFRFHELPIVFIGNGSEGRKNNGKPALDYTIIDGDSLEHAKLDFAVATAEGEHCLVPQASGPRATTPVQATVIGTQIDTAVSRTVNDIIIHHFRNADQDLYIHFVLPLLGPEKPETKEGQKPRTDKQIVHAPLLQMFHFSGKDKVSSTDDMKLPSEAALSGSLNIDQRQLLAARDNEIVTVRNYEFRIFLDGRPVETFGDAMSEHSVRFYFWSNADLVPLKD